MATKRASLLEVRIEILLKTHNCHGYVKELTFHPVRRWRFDFAFPEAKIAIEAEGGIWTRGAHTRGAHFNSDSEKYNAAAILGWKVLRYTTNTLYNLPQDMASLGLGTPQGG